MRMRWMAITIRADSCCFCQLLVFPLLKDRHDFDESRQLCGIRCGLLNGSFPFLSALKQYLMLQYFSMTKLFTLHVIGDPQYAGIGIFAQERTERAAAD